MAIIWSNNASSTVSGSITAVATTVQLAAGTGALFPNPTGGNYFCCTFYDQATKTQTEICHCTARSGDTLTIVRAQEGTTAQAWSASDIIANLVTAGTLAAFVQSGAGPANTSIVYVGIDTSTTPNLIIANTIPVPASYATGMLFNILVKNTNNAAVTMQLNGVAALAATRTDGSAMVGGNLTGSEEMIFVYNGVNFTSMVPPIPQQPPQTTFYVRTDGNDNNSGFANTPAAAFATISGAMYAIKTRYISQQTITIRVADGTYTDGFYDNQCYISAWNIVGNTTNPGNCLIIATSTNPAAYPPHAGPGNCVAATVTANVTANGFTFQSYGPNASCNSGAYLQLLNCNFTAPTSGTQGPIAVTSSGNIFIAGNCQYTGAIATQYLFGCSGSSSLVLGYRDSFTTNNLVFNIAGTPSVTVATALVGEAGSLVVHNDAVTFTGGVPACAQYNCSSAGGIVFTTGVTTIFPGTLPGVVTPPGWTG